MTDPSVPRDLSAPARVSGAASQHIGQDRDELAIRRQQPERLHREHRRRRHASAAPAHTGGTAHQAVRRIKQQRATRTQPSLLREYVANAYRGQQVVKAGSGPARLRTARRCMQRKTRARGTHERLVAVQAAEPSIPRTKRRGDGPLNGKTVRRGQQQIATTARPVEISLGRRHQRRRVLGQQLPGEERALLTKQVQLNRASQHTSRLTVEVRHERRVRRRRRPQCPVRQLL